MVAATCKLYPPVNEEKMQYFTLACTHVTLTLRCIKAGMTSELAGVQFAINDDEELSCVVMNGHKYIVLTDEIDAESAMQLSEWKTPTMTLRKANTNLSKYYTARLWRKRRFRFKAKPQSPR